MSSAAYFNMLATLMRDNPPAEDDAPIVERMARLGIIPGQPFVFGKLDPQVQQALQDVPKDSFEAIMAQFKTVGKVENGWLFTTKTGLYGTDYIQRALVTAIGLGANRPQDAVYPTSQVDAEGKAYEGTPRIDPNTDEIYADFEDESGFGDISLITLISPARLKSRFLWGIGPTFIFPTASKDELGQEKWQAGPSAVGLWMGKDWILGVFPQEWWSFAGNSDRKSTNLTNIQYFIWRMLPGEWQIGMSPNITMNWEADRDNRFTVPVGLGVGKLVRLGKLPLKIQLQGQYSVIHPDDYGQRWNFQLQLTPVIPNLISGTLF